MVATYAPSVAADFNANVKSGGKAPPPTSGGNITRCQPVLPNHSKREALPATGCQMSPTRIGGVHSQPDETHMQSILTSAETVTTTTYRLS